MTRSASISAGNLSPPEVAVDGGRFSGVIANLRKLLLGRRYETAIQDIQNGFGCSRRTAERIYAGQSVSGDTVLAGLVSERFGGTMVEDALRRVPLERRALVARSLRDSADLIRMEAEQEQLARQLADAKSRRAEQEAI